MQIKSIIWLQEVDLRETSDKTAWTKIEMSELFLPLQSTFAKFEVPKIRMTKDIGLAVHNEILLQT